MLLGLPDLAEENVENRDKSKITKHLIFVIDKGRQFTFFYKFDKFEIDFRACFK